jgi:hypothetical protein
VHAAKAAPSRLHWNVAVASVSVNENEAVVAVVGFPGLEVIAGGGGVGIAVIVHVYGVAALTCEPLSDRTLNVCEATLRGPA